MQYILENNPNLKINSDATSINNYMLMHQDRTKHINNSNHEQNKIIELLAKASDLDNNDLQE